MAEPNNNATGCFEVRCSVCGTRYKWVGKQADRPDCPFCKKRHPANLVTMAREAPRHPSRPIPNVFRSPPPNSRTDQQTNRPADPAGVRIPFGKHRGHTLKFIAETDDGLRYLDWLVGQEWVITKHRNLVEQIGQVLRQNADRLDQAIGD